MDNFTTSELQLIHDTLYQEAERFKYLEASRMEGYDGQHAVTLYALASKVKSIIETAKR